MEQKLVKSISREVYRRFPDISGSNPKVKKHSTGQFLLIFTKKVSLPTGKSMNRTVRVVADEKGKIVKVTTSR